MNNYLVTVAIALYNNAPYIERCIESVVNQTYGNLDIVIVDDGSKDDSLERCQRFLSDKRIRLISKANEGLSSVRQRCLEEASGDYICFIDADDYLTTNHIELLLQKISLDGSDIVVCSTRFEDSNGHLLEKESDAYSCLQSSKGEKLYNEIFESGFPLRIHLSDSWNKLYSTDFIRKSAVCFKLPKGYNGSDTLFNWKLAFHEPTYSSISNQGYVHVIYKSSAVHRRNKKLLDGFMIIIDQLLNEAVNARTPDFIKVAIYNKYVEYLRYAFTDEFNECKGFKNRNILLHELMTKEIQYRNQKSIKMAIRHTGTLSAFLFVFIYKYFSALLPLYLSIRAKLVKFS